MCEDCHWGSGDEPDAPPPAASWTDAAFNALIETLGKKRSDYSSSDEFENFTSTAEAVGTIDPEEVFLTQIAIKLGRIRSLRTQFAAPANEPLLDSYRDLAGYAVLAFAYEMKREAEKDETGRDKEGS